MSLALRNIAFTFVVPGIGGGVIPWWIPTRGGAIPQPVAWPAGVAIVAGVALYLLLPAVCPDHRDGRTWRAGSLGCAAARRGRGSLPLGPQPHRPVRAPHRHGRGVVLPLGPPARLRGTDGGLLPSVRDLVRGTDARSSFREDPCGLPARGPALGRAFAEALVTLPACHTAAPRCACTRSHAESARAEAIARPQDPR